MSVEAALEYWLASGVPKHKLILGMPLYGRVFTVANTNDLNIGADIKGPGLEGSFTREAGMLGFNEICQDLDWKHFWMRNEMVPVAVKDDQWLSYDNINSLGLKVDFANWHGLGGVMVWSIETDDFQNDCGHGKYPLLNAIKRALG
jgi:chitinase